MDDSQILKECIIEANKSTCKRAKGGSVIIKDGKVVARGFISPPAEMESQRRCTKDKYTAYDVKVTDKTCCMHAEQRAIFDLLKSESDYSGCDIYFVRLDEDGEPRKARLIYCTICSKMALDVGIENFCLFNGQRFVKYKTEHYNNLSYEKTEVI